MAEIEQELSAELQDKITEIFKKFDADGSKSIDKDETAKYWKENGDANSEALFKAVDVDASGTIEEDEWINYFKVVKGAGHSDKEIEDELQKLNEGISWVSFEKVATDRRKN